MLREQFVEGLAAAGDGAAQRDRVSLTGEGARTGLPRLFVPDTAVPVRVVFSVFEEGTLSFESFALGLLSPGALDRAAARGSAAAAERVRQATGGLNAAQAPGGGGLVGGAGR